VVAVGGYVCRCNVVMVMAYCTTLIVDPLHGWVTTVLHVHVFVAATVHVDRDRGG